MSDTPLVILFIALTLIVHVLLAKWVGDEAATLGFSRVRWTVFILITGLVGLVIWKAERRAALRSRYPSGSDCQQSRGRRP